MPKVVVGCEKIEKLLNLSKLAKSCFSNFIRVLVVFESYMCVM